MAAAVTVSTGFSASTIGSGSRGGGETEAGAGATSGEGTSDQMSVVESSRLAAVQAAPCKSPSSCALTIFSLILSNRVEPCPRSGPSQEPVRPYSRDSAASCEHHLRYNAEGVPRYPWIPGLCLLDDPAFLARLQPLDVLAMSVEQQQRQHRRQRSECGLAEPQQEQRG